MNQQKKTHLSFVETLGLIFITLKLCGVIDWSWWWVLGPEWCLLAMHILVAACSQYRLQRVSSKG